MEKHPGPHLNQCETACVFPFPTSIHRRFAQGIYEGRGGGGFIDHRVVHWVKFAKVVLVSDMGWFKFEIRSLDHF